MNPSTANCIPPIPKRQSDSISLEVTGLECRIIMANELQVSLHA
jgi:hypothetical protein